MYKVIPMTVVVYCEECTVARYYLEYMKKSGYLVEKVILLLNGERPQKLSWLWRFFPKILIARLRKYKVLKERSSGELKSFINYVGGFFDTKIDLMGNFAFHEYAKESILHSRWAAAYYKQQRERGGGHNTAVRALAYKWQRIIWKCWQDRVPYQEDIYEAALRRRNSPLAAALEGIVVGKSPLKSNGNKK